MMAGKAGLFGDAEAERLVLAARRPGARPRGGTRGPRLRRGQPGRGQRYDLVVAANAAKFGQHPALRAYLLGTGRAGPGRGEPADAIWGIGLSRRTGRGRHPARWRGLNLLGFALMDVRAALRS